MRHACLKLALCTSLFVTVWINGCAPNPGPSFIGDDPPSALNGLWMAAVTTRPTGIAIFDVDGGTWWSPHGLSFDRSGIYATHSCNDFRLDATSGTLSIARGAKSLGRTTPLSDGGIRLEWDVERTGQWLELLRRDYRTVTGVRTGVRSIDFEGTLTRVDAETVRLSARMTYRIWSSDGGTETDEIPSEQDLSRVRQCR
jgi:hypothetical protein